MKNYHYVFQASFVASGNRTDISLDDPNFWQKWAKKAEIDIDAISGRVSIYFPLKNITCGNTLVILL